MSLSSATNNLISVATQIHIVEAIITALKLQLKPSNFNKEKEDRRGLNNYNMHGTVRQTLEAESKITSLNDFFIFYLKNIIKQKEVLQVIFVWCGWNTLNKSRYLVVHERDLPS